MLGLPSLRRNLGAAFRDVVSPRSETRRSALLDLLAYVDSDQRAKVIAAIVQRLEADNDAELRAMAALGIADAGLTETVPNLVRALQDDAPRVKQMALLALGEVGKDLSRSELEQIQGLLTSTLPALRYQALVAWSRLTERRGIGELLSATSDADEEVRWLAWTLIEKQLIELAGQGGQSQFDAAAMALLGSAYGAQFTRLKSLLRAHSEQESLRLRSVVAAILHRLGESAALGRLLECAQGGATLSRQQLAHLAQEFGRLRFEPARSWLAIRARRGWLEGAVGWPALVSLAALGDEVAKVAVVEELSASSLARRSRALVAIGELKLKAASLEVAKLRAKPAGLDPALVEHTWEALSG